MRSIFSYNLYNIRQWCNLSYDEMSNALNVPRANLSAYEKGTREPKLSAIIDISNKLNLSLDDLATRYISLEKYQYNMFYQQHFSAK